MICIRPYKKCDAKTILSWIQDEEAFRKWSADRYEGYPVQEADMNEMYEKEAYSDGYFPMTAYDEEGIVGHFILRFTDSDKKLLRLGFIIIDIEKRGRGLGEEMVRKACRYAFDYLGADKVTLGVFVSNPEAERCYQKAGFHERLDGKRENVTISGEEWTVIDMEKKSHYLLNEPEKKAKGGSDYFEFSMGDKEIKGGNSLYLCAEDYEMTGIKGLLKSEITNFDQYGHNEIIYDMWERLFYRAKEKGGSVKDLMTELAPWAEKALQLYEGFQIIGL